MSRGMCSLEIKLAKLLLGHLHEHVHRSLVPLSQIVSAFACSRISLISRAKPSFFFSFTRSITTGNPTVNQ